MPTIVESLVIALGLDSKGVNTGLQQVSNKVQTEANKLDTALTEKARSMSNNFLAPFRAVVAPLIGAMSLGTAVSQYTSAADAVGKLSDAFGVNMEDLQAWGEAAARAGGTVQGFQTTIQSFNARLQASAAKGSDETSKMLAQLGVSALDASGKARNAFEVLRDMAEAAGGIDKAEFKGLAEKLGIDRGTIMLLQQGRTSLDDLIKRQKELGVYTKEDAEIAAKFNDATADMMQVIKAASAGLMRLLVPAITWLTDKLTIVVGYMRDNTPTLIIALSTIATIMSAKLAPAAWKAMAPFLPWAGLIAAIILVLDDLYAYMDGGDSVFAEFWSAFGTGEEIQQKINQAWKDFREILTQAWEKIKPFVPELVKFVPLVLALGAGFKAMRGVVSILTGIASGFGTILKAFNLLRFALLTNPVGLFVSAMALAIGLAVANWDKLKAVAIKVADAIKEKWEKVKIFFSETWDNIKNKFQQSLDKITEFVQNNKAVQFLKNAWNGIKTFFSDLWDDVFGIFRNGINTIKGLWNDVLSFFGMAGDAAEVVVEEGKKAHEFYQGMEIDPEELAERAANGEDVSMYAYKRPTAADSVSTGGLNAAGGDVEQTVNNSTEVRMGNITINTQATDAAGISQGMRDQLTAKWGSLNMAAQSGVNAK